MCEIAIPTINDTCADFRKLAHIQNESMNTPCNTIKFTFHSCNFLRANAVAFIGSLARELENNNKKIHFDWTSFSNQAVLINLMQNGFAEAFGHSSKKWHGRSVHYREDTNQQTMYINDYLENRWLGRGWLYLSEDLKATIISKVWELYCNAFEHSNTKSGVVSCGQFFHNKKELTLAIVDSGIGIACSVRRFLKANLRHVDTDMLPSDKCLKWAFANNHTTTGNQLRGTGLYSVTRFIKCNSGRLDIYSNDGYACVTRDGVNFALNTFHIKGTVVYITLNCDGRYYTS